MRQTCALENIECLLPRICNRIRTWQPISRDRENIAERLRIVGFCDCNVHRKLRRLVFELRIAGFLQL